MEDQGGQVKFLVLVKMDKEFKTWLILDYKTGSFRLNKKKPIKIKASEIPIDMKITVKIPEQPIIKATGYIELDTMKVKEMILENLEEPLE